MTAEVREPLYRLHECKPSAAAPAVDRMEWAIECCMQAAWDTDSAELYGLLTVWNPGMDDEVLRGVDGLLGLAEEVRDSRWGVSARRRCAEQEYEDALYLLARDLLRSVRPEAVAS